MLKVGEEKSEVRIVNDQIGGPTFAGDIANAIYQIVINGVSGSYVIGSGVGHKIADILDIVFNFLDLDQDIVSDLSLIHI